MKTRPNNWIVSLPLLLTMWWSAGVPALEAEDVVRLDASGYSDEDILEVIAATQSEFLLSARDVVYLTQSRVADDVIQNMLVALPVDPDSAGGADPVRLKFMAEDLHLLAQNNVADAVIVTFIETREMAFTLDTNRLTALRDAGLGLDALQLLVEKSAAATPAAPFAPPAPAPVLATGSGDYGNSYGYSSGTPGYFFGNSGNTYSTYQPVQQVQYQDFYYPQPSVLIRTSVFSPWYLQAYSYRPHQHYYGYPSYYSPVRPYYPGYAYTYPYGYPYGGYGYHDFHCPRGPHSHGRGWDRDRDRDRDHDRDHDRDRDNDGQHFVGGGKGGNGGKGGVGGTGNIGSNTVKPTTVRPGTWNGGRPVTGNGYTREPTTPTHTFKPLGTQPLYGKSATGKSSSGKAVTVKPATQRDVTGRPTMQSIAVQPAPTIPGVKSLGTKTATTTRSPLDRVVSPEATYAPRGAATYTVAPDARAPAASGGKRESDERAGGTQVKSGIRSDGDPGRARSIGSRSERPR